WPHWVVYQSWRRSRTRAMAAAMDSSSASGTHLKSTRHRPWWTRATTAGSPSRSPAAQSSGSSTAQPGRGTPGAPPPPTRPSWATTAAPAASARASVRARSRSGSIWRASWIGLAVWVIVASRAARVSLSVRSARASGCSASVCTASARPRTIPAWGPAGGLVAGDDDEIGTGPQRGIDVRFVGQRLSGGEESGAEVDDERKIVLGRERGQFGHLDRGGEALHAEVARMHFEQARCVLTDGFGVVGQVGAVRRSNVFQATSR